MKKGFTLIELLAVIVILAVIALIASPIIIGLIDDARKESFKDSTYGIVKAGEIFFSQNLLNGVNEEVTFTYTDGVESSSIPGKKLDYNGQKPTSGEVKVNKEGQIAIALHNGAYCTEKGYEDSEVTLSEKTKEECKIDGTSKITFTCGQDLIDSRDSKVYKTVQIGEQCWMAENLRYTGNGCTGKTWNDTEPHDACQSHSTDWGEEILYQWGAAMNDSTTEKAQGLCLDGWYIPTDAEWKILEGTVDSTYGIGNPEWDDSDDRGNDAGTKLKAKPTIWDGSDTVGFTAKPAGGRFTDGSLGPVGSRGGWWTSSGSGSGAWFRLLISGGSYVIRGGDSQASGGSVRCLLGQ